jgi:hypothetical protein
MERTDPPPTKPIVIQEFANSFLDRVNDDGLEEKTRNCREVWLRGVDLNHRPLGYELGCPKDSISFQRLDAVGRDRKSLERP